ncbi:hypothetical protein JKP88DRAFT_199230 [Tribonema minus]|uniref:Glyceraldehyde-3-phosphate dehydrogenase n=1 Tax=Tribonema minus TaxID=303371 RepID=A0A835YYT8_9STRA|nr:hypothetical protein JKP88DRAFT_199230 [Tribonema minus]
MVVKVAINGFGRIGRCLFRFLEEDPTVAEVVHVNELLGGAETGAYLLEFDSVHGRYAKTIVNLEDDSGFTVDGRLVTFSNEKTIEAVDWAAKGVQLVCDCTGVFLTKAKLQPYLAAGVQRVVVSAPVKEEGVLNVVVGVNDTLLGTQHTICTAASCTTNCLAPVVKVIHENLRIKHGVITTIHDVTGTQPLVDMPMTKKKDLRRCRSGMVSMAPTSTGSATAITNIFPDLKGKLNGMAVRVPLLNGSITDCVFEVERETSVEEVNGLLSAAASEGPLKGILGYETRPLVSVDYINEERSGVVDAPSTMVVNGTCVKLYVWYDNEWGYSKRMAELVAKVAQMVE